MATPGVNRNWAGLFLGIALVAGLLGFTGLAGETGIIARILFGLFLVFFLVALLWGKPAR